MDQAHLDYEGDDCIPWPYPVDNHGYGQVGHHGKIYKASRLMCILLHGEPPTEDHEAAHSCGNGHLACMNRKHISWKTRAENQQDRVAHGRGGRAKDLPRHKLTSNEVEEIRRRSQSERLADLAREFDVSPSAISKIKDGSRWNGNKYNMRLFSREEIDRIKAMRGTITQKALGEEYGVSHSVIGNIQNGRYHKNERVR